MVNGLDASMNCTPYVSNLQAQGSQGYQDWDIKQGPRIFHASFEFDADVAKDDFGAFGLSFENNAELFEANLVEGKVPKVVKAIAPSRTKKRNTKSLA
jgi:hypothetical protein